MSNPNAGQQNRERWANFTEDRRQAIRELAAAGGKACVPKGFAMMDKARLHELSVRSGAMSKRGRAKA